MLGMIKNTVNLCVPQKASSFSFSLLGKMPEAKGEVSVLKNSLDCFSSFAMTGRSVLCLTISHRTSRKLSEL